MRIGFVSYEFPPETGGGGIGTYLEQICRLLAEAGNDVVVFAGAKNKNSSIRVLSGLEVRKIVCEGSILFREAVLSEFTACHAANPFDVIEGCDFDASALEIKRRFPEVPYVVKLHTPRFLIDEMHYHRPPGAQLLRMWFGALRRGNRLRMASLRESQNARAEIESIRLADEIAAPSAAIGEAAVQWSGVSPDRITVFPLPFDPPAALLDIPTLSTTKVVTFIGRLEERKGTYDLAAAIPRVLQRHPDANFRLIGRSMVDANTGRDHVETLRKQLGDAAARVDFTGPLPRHEVEAALGTTDILVAPSHWESFGLVCLEGMAAGRAVVGSSSGGMAEMLEDGCGLLVSPRSPALLADAISRLMDSPTERARLGTMARQRVLTKFDGQSVMKLQMQSYQRALERCRASAAAAVGSHA